MSLSSFVVPLLVGLLGVFGQVNTSTVNCVEGKGPVEEQKRDITDFSVLEIDGSFDLQFQSGPAALTVKTEKNLHQHIVTERLGNTLKIYSDRSICAKKALAITLASPKLEKVISTGANDMAFRKLHGTTFHLESDGAGDVKLAGRVNALTVRYDGSGDLQAADLEAAQVDLRLDGSSSVVVHASELLKVVSHGAADVCYHGSPARVERHVEGVGDVEPCDE